MHNTQGFAERFMGRNPIPATPNPLVNQTIAQLRFVFCKLWILKTAAAIVQSAVTLDRCGKRKRGAMFIRMWEFWQRSLMDAIERTFGVLFDIGRANVDCALPDPAAWAFDTMYRLIVENSSWLGEGEHVVGEWVRTVCRRSPVEIWEVSGWWACMVSALRMGRSATPT